MGILQSNQTPGSAAELEEFVSFAQSPAGRDYYRAALAAVKAALQGPVQSAGL